MNANAKIFLRSDFTKKDGTNPVYLRLTINRSKKDYSLNVSTLVKDWNPEKGQVKRTHPEERKINLIITNKLNRAREIIFKYQVNNLPVTFLDFERDFFAPIFSDNSFYSYVKYSIMSKEGIFSKDTIRTHYTQLSKIKKFRPNLSFNEISVKFMDSYQNYMLKELGNNRNTCNKSLTFVKVIVNRAIREGVIKKNPIETFTIKSVKGNREFLSLIELQALESLFNKPLNKKYQRVLQYFLFSCYTGLRYQDIKDLRFRNIDKDMITLVMHKTRERVNIPLIKKAKDLIGTGFPEQRVFRVYVNQVTNRYLKDLSEKARINKKITFHSARHTFATVGLELGIPIEYISSLLGHKDLQTTQIYTKILDYKKVEEMRKWENA
ncbi:MAG: site-specific integrase [bacterium]